MKMRFLLPALTACLGLLAASSSANAQIWGYGGYGGGFGGGLGLFDPLYGGGLYYGGLNPYSNAGRSFSNPAFGFRSTPASTGTSFGWSPYAGTPGEVSYTPDPKLVADPILRASFAPGAGVSGDVASATATLTRQNFYSGPASTKEKIEFHIKVPTASTKLYFNGNQVDQTGESRWLGTEPLNDAMTYAYYVRATWITSDGKEVSYVKSLHAKPGQLLTIDFTKRATATESTD